MRFTTHERDGIFRIVFDDGGMNLLSARALGELGGIIGSLPGRVDLLVFESGRARVFAAGADMQEMSRFTHVDAARFSSLGQDLFRAIDRLPIASVASIDGDCFGGALDLALSFDVRLATSRSRFAHPGAKLGIVTGFGGTLRWRKALAPAGAAAMFLGNHVFDGVAAAGIGLVDAIVDEGKEETIARMAASARRNRARIALFKELRPHLARTGGVQAQFLARRSFDLYSVASG